MRTITKPSGDRTNKNLRGKLRIATLTGVMISMGWLALLSNPTRATAAGAPSTNVKLAWDRSASSDVVGYRIYYGVASGNYTNSVAVGNVTNYTFSNLVNGVAYYFTTVAYNAAGIESRPSNETLVVPDGTAMLQLKIAANKQAVLTLTGKSGHTYEIQSSANLTSWSVIGSVTVGASGTATYTDTSAPSQSKRFYRTRDTTP